MIECEATGRNIEQAITNALYELKALREDVDIKILEQGGLFKKAKVYVKISDDALDKYVKPKQNLTDIENKDDEEIKETPIDNSSEETENIDNVQENLEEENAVKEVKTVKNIDELEKGKNFLIGLLEVINNHSKVFSEENSDEIVYEIQGENASNLIGYRGESLNAIQYLVSIINSKGNRHSKRVKVDIGGFKEKRKESLEALANRIAKKVLKTSHQTKLEPMTAYERRIIHTVIQNYPELTSFSTGEEPHRFLTICLKGKEDN